MPGRASSPRVDALAAALRKLARAVDEARYHPGIPPAARERLLDHLEGGAHHATKALAAASGRAWCPGDPAVIVARGEYGFYEVLERYTALARGPANDGDS